MSPSQLATFAAGCFWSVELVYQREPGVLSTRVGYTGGSKEHPTYKEVCTGQTGHAEAVELEYDPDQVSYGRLLEVFWDKHDPTQADGQGADLGSQYRSAIFTHTPEQAQEARASRDLKASARSLPIVTQILEAGTFWPAESDHQRYLESKTGQSAAKSCSDPIRCYG
ncbi:peptide methionine sulfoxide reductase MsrA [Piptocephalis cylindrospora]|uniref:peptide-methionine (S)-S-oxide reductase n=1 Tax=Piptocephalis cylindrospora TaxID=1907219 RepID=A0A4P9Y2H4_9FUNG|nr:peptide methionine sulfoxide reductase MsrA [Piptocephalis cylindrospora]|eukprot:RKP13078.1 peptide methionine sulfoxide reductase MsrA [Piptocephalis cylindrospora]